MNRTVRILAAAALVSCLSLLLGLEAFCAEGAHEQSPLLVGRLTEAQGNVLRYLGDKDDWVLIVKDTPVRAEEALYSDETGRAELSLPNKSMARIGGDTEFQITKMGEDLTEVDVGSGMARLINKSPSTIVKATTPFGYVLGPPKSSFDLYVGKESVEVISLKDKVFFVPLSEAAKYEVIAGESSILADGKETGLGSGTTDADWNTWNVERDALFEKRIEVKGDSVQYLPEELKSDAYALDEDGKWEKIYYDKCKCETSVWKPVRVKSDWAPFTAGRWTEWYGDQCWVPDESFGYVTHHYGNWINVNGGWYWAPPVVSVPGGPAPVVSVGLDWYPGRVAWFNSDEEIGWIPLAPYEPYYSVGYWGPASVVVGAIAAPGIYLGGYAYSNYSVIVDQRNFYGVNNYYSTTIVRNVHVSRLQTYRPLHYVHDKAFRDPSSFSRRHDFTNRTPGFRPGRDVAQHVQHVNAKAREMHDPNGRSLAGKTAKIPRSSEPLKRAELPRPTTSMKKPTAATQTIPSDRQPASERPHGPTSEPGEHAVGSHRPTAEQADRALKADPGGKEHTPGANIRSPRAAGAEQVKPASEPSGRGEGPATAKGAAAGSREATNPEGLGRKHPAREPQAAQESSKGATQNAKTNQAGASGHGSKAKQERGAGVPAGLGAQIHNPGTGSTPGNRELKGSNTGRGRMQPRQESMAPSVQKTRPQQSQQPRPQPQQMQQPRMQPQIQPKMQAQPRPQPQPKAQPQPKPQQQGGDKKKH
jgi:hypothetical protein